MNHIRPAAAGDLCRIAETVIFNYRLHFYPIFRNDDFYFREMQVNSWMEENRNAVGSMWVYDDGAVKGFVQVENGEIRRLFVEPALQGKGIGARLLRHAVCALGGRTLWALEKNTRAIAFYEKHGFRKTADRKPEEGTEEYLIRLEMYPQ